MLTRLAHRIVAHPRVYDAVQTVLGARRTARILAAELRSVTRAPFVLDLGGGTGTYRAQWSPSGAFICLDLDPLKLQGYRGKYPDDLLIQGDATCLPLGAGSVDVAFCSAVSHHIPDGQITALFGEAARVLRVGGHLVFLDALWEPAWLPGRLLWKYDRGSFPRGRETLKALISGHFGIVRWREFRTFHAYILCVGVKEERHA